VRESSISSIQAISLHLQAFENKLIMKTITSLLFFLIFLWNFTIGQTEPRLYKIVKYQEEFSGFELSSIQNIFYDYFGNISKEITDQYQVNQTSSRIGVFYTYNDKNQLIKKTSRRHNSDLDFWITTSWWEYMYDENGCEIESNYIRNTGGFVSNYIYERNENCKLLSVGRWIRSSILEPPTAHSELKYTYFQDGISYEEDYRSYDISSGEVFLTNRLVFKFNDEHQLKEYYQLIENQNEWFGKKRVNTYDDQGNMTEQVIYNCDNDTTVWDLGGKVIFNNLYDDENRLLETTEENYYFSNGDFHFSYESFVNSFNYECQGLVNTKIAINESPFLIGLIKEEYSYEGKNDCFDIENTSLEMSIYPNPSSGDY